MTDKLKLQINYSLNNIRLNLAILKDDLRTGILNSTPRKYLREIEQEINNLEFEQKLINDGRFDKIKYITGK